MKMSENNATSQHINEIKVSVVDLPLKVPKKSKSNKLKKDPNDESNKKKISEKRQEYLRMFMAEFLGTGLLMFFGCMGCIKKFEKDNGEFTLERIDVVGAAAFGLTVMLIIQLLGHISGAHLNPAVTIATVLYKILSIRMAIVYMVAQFAGACLGYGLLKLLVTDAYAPDGFCNTEVNTRLSVGQGLVIEVVITTVLIMVCGAVWDKRNEEKQDSTPLRFGLVIILLSFTAGPLTGASMNTARSVAPLVYGGDWKDHWIYWVGPNAGAFFGFAIYKYLFGLPEEEKGSEADNVCLEEINGVNPEKV